MVEIAQDENIQLFDADGQRLYLTGEERKVLDVIAWQSEDEQARTFCHMLLYTGCRISEALSLSYSSIDFANSSVTFRTLKRRKIHFRSVPLSQNFLDTLRLVHKPDNKSKKKEVLLWDFSRTTAWRRVKALMSEAGIEGVQASPKGLRHGFGVACIERNIPVNVVQKWLGHASPNTTAIYLQVVGTEERQFASRLWEN